MRPATAIRLRRWLTWWRYKFWLHLGHWDEAWAAHLQEIESEYVRLGGRRFIP
jgi:hypothetical protein